MFASAVLSGGGETASNAHFGALTFYLFLSLSKTNSWSCLTLSSSTISLTHGHQEPTFAMPVVAEITAMPRLFRKRV